MATLTNKNLNSLYATAIADGSYNYNEMLNLLQTAATGGITGTEWADLKTAYTESQQLFTSDYLKTISYNVINGNTANDKWYGGKAAQSLGNMSDSTTQTNAERLIGKWFLGTDLPISIVADRDGNGNPTPDNYSVAAGSLFVNGLSANDVNQGSTGTCYLLSSLGAIANVNSTLIKDSFIDNGNGTYGVRFYDEGKPVYTTVDKSLPVYNNRLSGVGDANHSPNGELWTSLLEKAYVDFNYQIKINTADQEEKSYKAIDYDGPYPIKQITNLDITGYMYKSYSAISAVGADVTDYTGLALIPQSGGFGAKTASSSTIDVKQNIINALNTGSIGWLGSQGKTTGDNGKINFFAGHAYMLLGYNNSSDTFTVRNPWGDAASYDTNPEFQASFTDFWNSTINADIVLSSPAKSNSIFKYTITSSASSTPVTEGNAVTFTVTRSGKGSASSVYVSTLDDNTNSSDYAVLNKSAVTFAADETVRTFTVNINKDTLTEGTERFWVDLYTASSDTTATTSILSYIQDVPVDNNNYSYTIDSSAITTPAIEGSPVTFTVTRSSTGSASSVYVSTANGSADNSDYAAFSKVAINFAANDTSQTVTVDTYKDTLTEGTEYFLLDLYKTATDTSPTASSYGYIKDPSIGTDYNYTVDATSIDTIEGDAVVFTVSRSGSGSDSTVYVSTDDGYATSGDDYGALNKVAINFATNETTKTFTVDTYADAITEGYEEFWVDLYKADTDTIPLASNYAYINDTATDDYSYSILEQVSPTNEGEAITFTVNRSGTGSASTVYVYTDELSGSATAGSDYGTLNNLAINFGADETNKTFTVDTYKDSLEEDSEYFWVDLYDESDNYVADSYAYINDVSNLPVDSYSYTVGSSSAVTEGNTATFTITRSGTGTTSTVYANTFDGSATTNDYWGLQSMPVIFSANETTKTISVSTYNDGITESSENFWLGVNKSATDTSNSTTLSSAYVYVNDVVKPNILPAGVTYTPSGNPGQAFRIYKAAFDRMPDKGGLDFWLTTLNSGKSLTAVASGFMSSPEFIAMYGTNPTAENFVTKVYNNVLHRAPEAGGYNYWVGIIHAGSLSQAGTLASISESAENQAAVLALVGVSNSATQF